MISALGDALIPSSADINAALHMDGMEGEQLLEAAKAEIERFRTLDYVVPSYHNVVTISCLQVGFRLTGIVLTLTCNFIPEKDFDQINGKWTDGC